jgi:hypothetical protein
VYPYKKCFSRQREAIGDGGKTTIHLRLIYPKRLRNITRHSLGHRYYSVPPDQRILADYT